MSSSLSKYHKEALWGIFLKSQCHAALQFTLLTQEHGILIATTKDMHTFSPYTHNISVMEVLITQHKEPYAYLHAVVQSYPFTHLNSNLAKLTRATLWQESLIMTKAGGSEKEFFILYYYLLLWLNQPSIAARLLDIPFLYYFSLLNGLLPPHLSAQPSFSYIVSLTEDDRLEYFLQLADNTLLYQQLYHIFATYLPYIPKSLHQLHRYD